MRRGMPIFLLTFSTSITDDTELEIQLTEFIDNLKFNVCCDSLQGLLRFLLEESTLLVIDVMPI